MLGTAGVLALAYAGLSWWGDRAGGDAPDVHSPTTAAAVAVPADDDLALIAQLAWNIRTPAEQQNICAKVAVQGAAEAAGTAAQGIDGMGPEDVAALERLFIRQCG